MGKVGLGDLGAEKDMDQAPRIERACVGLCSPLFFALGFNPHEKHGWPPFGGNPVIPDYFCYPSLVAIIGFLLVGLLQK